jgi:hypothetical protein
MKMAIDHRKGGILATQYKRLHALLGTIMYIILSNNNVLYKGSIGNCGLPKKASHE